MVSEHSYPSCRCRFECQWVSGVPDGEATVTYANGDRYEGNYVAYTRRGQGTMLYADGSKCVSYGHRLGPFHSSPCESQAEGARAACITPRRPWRSAESLPLCVRFRGKFCCAHILITPLLLL